MAGSAGIRGLAVVNPSRFQWRNAIEDELIRLSSPVDASGIRSRNNAGLTNINYSDGVSLLTLPKDLNLRYT